MSCYNNVRVVINVLGHLRMESYSKNVLNVLNLRKSPLLLFIVQKDSIHSDNESQALYLHCEFHDFQASVLNCIKSILDQLSTM